MLPSLSTTDAVTVPSLFKLVGFEMLAKSISVFEMVVVCVLLFLLFTMKTTVSATYVAVMAIWNQLMTERSIGSRKQSFEQFPTGLSVIAGAKVDTAVALRKDPVQCQYQPGTKENC